MNYYALIYELVDDMVNRRVPFREEHLRLAREARERDLQFPAPTDSSVATRLRARLVAIQTGRDPDTHNWLLPV